MHHSRYILIKSCIVVFLDVCLLSTVSITIPLPIQRIKFCNPVSVPLAHEMINGINTFSVFFIFYSSREFSNVVLSTYTFLTLIQFVVGLLACRLNSSFHLFSRQPIVAFNRLSPHPSSLFIGFFRVGRLKYFLVSLFWIYNIAPLTRPRLPATSTRTKYLSFIVASLICACRPFIL